RAARWTLSRAAPADGGGAGALTDAHADRDGASARAGRRARRRARRPRCALGRRALLGDLGARLRPMARFSTWPLSFRRAALLLRADRAQRDRPAGGDAGLLGERARRGADPYDAPARPLRSQER